MQGQEREYPGGRLSQHRGVRWWVVLRILCLAFSSLASLAIILKLIDILS